MDRASKLFLVLCAKISRDHHTAPDGDPVKKADHRECDMTGHTDSSKGVITGEVPNDPRICHIVALLQELTEKQRDRKGDQAPRYGSFCQAPAFL